MSPIEQYLLNASGWVKASELVDAFKVEERALRSRGDQEGLCSGFAISGNLGYKHLQHATEEEWTAFYLRERSHSLGQFKRLKRLRQARARIADSISAGLLSSLIATSTTMAKEHYDNASLPTR